VQVGKHTNLVKDLFTDKTPEGLARYENVQELLNSIKEWTETPENEEDGEVGNKGLGAFLQNVALFTDSDKDKENEDVVKLMTIHAAKGLEFGCVFVGGIEETLFPSAMSINTREELEEERRLFYVAITRAKDRLWLTYANARYRFGQLVQNEPSRFLEEMPEAFLDKTYAGGGARNQGMSNMGTAFERMNRGFGGSNGQTDVRYGEAPAKKPENARPSYMQPAAIAQPQTVTHVPTENFVASDTSGLEAGQRVEHQKFGFGTVAKVEGSAHNPIANINFDTNGEKKIMLNYAKLRIL
jgi:DNA helicase-2/ATP-dependent DNA helicase PcrA